jgi:SAM-dependent methyltransferase
MAEPALKTSFRPAPFDAVAETYDETFTMSRIGRAQRQVVTQELDRVFLPGQRILELNCGTGVDALHLASRGVKVLACDSAPRMIAVARRKAARAWLNVPPDFRVLETEEIGALLEGKGSDRFDGAFSNFAGLNCVGDLRAVASEMGRLLRPGAKAVLCFFGPFCLWEIIWHLGRGNPAKAFRRLGTKPAIVQLPGTASIEVHYTRVRKLIRTFAPNFRLLRWKGVGVAVPPSYLETLARRFPRTLKLAVKTDAVLGRCPLIRAMADHVLLTFERVKEQ